jgi:hypothetical protein
MRRPFRALGQVRPHRLPQPGLRREATTHELYHARQAVGQFGIRRSRGDLILPQFDIAAGQGFEIRRLRHESDDIRQKGPKDYGGAPNLRLGQPVPHLICCAT